MTSDWVRPTCDECGALGHYVLIPLDAHGKIAGHFLPAICVGCADKPGMREKHEAAYRQKCEEGKARFKKWLDECRRADES